jgi:membrane fusion protein (multidrug efflux system)
MPSFPAARVRAPHVVCALAAALLAVACSKQAPAPERPAPEVTVITIAPQTIPFSPTFVAQTESSRQVNIVARVSGFLERIEYQEGELVKQGQVMFTLDTKPFVAQLNAAQGELQSQQARLVTAEATYGRVKPLTDQDALPLTDLDRAKGELDSAKAAVFSARAKVEEAQLNLGYATIASPVTGLAGRALQRQGAFVNSMADSANLTYVAAIDPIWVNFSISQNQMARWQALVKKGELVRPTNENYDVDILLPGDVKYPYRGKISFSDPSFSQDTGSFMVRAVLPNPKLELRPGMFVTAIVRGATRPNAIVIPQLAVQQGNNGHFVYVVGASSLAELRPVVVGDYVGDKDILISAGLQGGDRVVVEGVLKVAPGKPVNPVAAGGTPAGASPPAPPATAPAAAPAKK